MSLWCLALNRLPLQRRDEGSQDSGDSTPEDDWDSCSPPRPMHRGPPQRQTAPRARDEYEYESTRVSSLTCPELPDLLSNEEANLGSSVAPAY